MKEESMFTRNEKIFSVFGSVAIALTVISFSSIETKIKTTPDCTLTSCPADDGHPDSCPPISEQSKLSSLNQIMTQYHVSYDIAKNSVDNASAQAEQMCQLARAENLGHLWRKGN